MTAIAWSLFGLLAALVAAVIAALFNLAERVDTVASRLDAVPGAAAGPGPAARGARLVTVH